MFNWVLLPSTRQYPLHREAFVCVSRLPPERHRLSGNTRARLFVVSTQNQSPLLGWLEEEGRGEARDKVIPQPENERNEF
jgi:hypothetical protein